MSDQIRWGILGTAKIARNFLIPALQASSLNTISAVGSRDPERGKAFAAEIGPDVRAFGSYEAMLDDPDIDAVYNPLPNHLHVPLTLEAAKRGKHVLCEKPIGLSHADAAALREVPPDINVMEAFMVRFHPQWLEVRRRVQSGDLGTVRAIQAFFSYYNDDPSNIRNQVDIGGGGIMDIGCYPMLIGRFLFDANPLRAVSLIQRDLSFGTDNLASAILDFGEDRQLSFMVSTQAVPHQRVSVVGTSGRIDVMIPFNAPTNQETALRLDRGAALGDAKSETITIAPTDQYEQQVDAFARAIQSGSPAPYGVEDALANMAVLDAIFRSEVTHAWVEIDYS
ncbi:MAG: Gfo/Idh/MocA family oxidoreductase [Pseudomonadota bacterium]